MSEVGPDDIQVFTWRSAWRRHEVNACKKGCFYCRLAKRLATPPLPHLALMNEQVEKHRRDRLALREMRG